MKIRSDDIINIFHKLNRPTNQYTPIDKLRSNPNNPRLLDKLNDNNLIEEIKYHINFNNDDYGKCFRCPNCNHKLPIYILLNKKSKIKELSIDKIGIRFKSPQPIIKLSKPSWD